MLRLYSGVNVANSQLPQAVKQLQSRRRLIVHEIHVVVETRSGVCNVDRVRNAHYIKCLIEEKITFKKARDGR